MQERVYLLFVMTLGDSPDIIATLFAVPSIVICRASQRRLATERLGYPLSVYDDLRTRGCSYNLPSRKPGGATSPAAPPCRTAAAAAAAVAAAAVGGCNDARTNSSSGGPGSKDSGSAAAAAVAASVSGAVPSALTTNDIAALMNNASQALPVASDGGKRINAPLPIAQAALANAQGLGAILDSAARASKPPLHGTRSDGSSGRAGKPQTEGCANVAGARGSRDGTDSMEDDDELTQDEDDTDKVNARPGDGTGTANNASSSARSRGTKRSSTDAPAASTVVAASSCKVPAEMLKLGAMNLAQLRVGGQQLPILQPEQNHPGVQEAHNLVSKVPRLTESSVAVGARAAVAAGVPVCELRAEDHPVNGSPPASSQPLQALLALCNSPSNKTHLSQQLAAVAGTGAPAGAAEQKGGAAAAAAIASALRSTATASTLGVPVGRKASALDIQKLYQLQSKNGSSAGASAGPATAIAAAQRSPSNDSVSAAAFGHRRGISGSPLGAYLHPNLSVMCSCICCTLDGLVTCFTHTSRTENACMHM